MTRMIEYLRDDLRVILTHPGPESFLGIPCVGAAPDYWSKPLPSRAYGRLRDRIAGGWDEHVLRILRRADLTHILLNYVSSAMAARPMWDSLDVPVLIHCHGFDVDADSRCDDNPTKLLWRENLAEEILDLAQRVSFIANSEWTRKKLLGLGVPDTSIFLKYFGVETHSVPPGRRSDGTEISILYLGRLVDCKGPDQVIRAFEIARHAGLRGRLTIAGDGPMRVTCELMRLASPFRERISILGAVDRELAATLMRDADVFTSHHQVGPITRREEAFGVAVLEAHGWGLPVVCGRSGGVPEIVDDGVTGILVTPGDVETHASAFLKLAGSAALRGEMSMAGQERARLSFSLEVEQRRIYEILDAVG